MAKRLQYPELFVWLRKKFDDVVGRTAMSADDSTKLAQEAQDGTADPITYNRGKQTFLIYPVVKEKDVSEFRGGAVKKDPAITISECLETVPTIVAETTHYIIPIALNGKYFFGKQREHFVLLHVTIHPDFGKNTATLYEPKGLSSRLYNYGFIRKAVKDNCLPNMNTDMNIVCMGDQALTNERHCGYYTLDYAAAILENNGGEIATFRQRHRGKIWLGFLALISGGILVASYFAANYLPTTFQWTSLSLTSSATAVGYSLLLGLAVVVGLSLVRAVYTIFADRQEDLSDARHIHESSTDVVEALSRDESKNENTVTLAPNVIEEDAEEWQEVSTNSKPSENAKEHEKPDEGPSKKPPVPGPFQK